MTFSNVYRRAGIAAIVLAAAMLGAAGCATTLNNKSCTELGCGQQGIHVEFSYKDSGMYAVDVTVDGVKVTCTATIPLPRGATGDDACVAAGIYLSRVGSELPFAQQSIGGLVIAKANATSVGVRITRDGTLLKEATFSPAYTVTSGPNGPDCEPKQCKSATFALK